MICLSSSSNNKESILQEAFLIKTKADIIEVRTDLLEELTHDHIQEIIAKISKKIIFTFKDKHLELIPNAIELGAHYIDIEHNNPNAKKIIKSKKDSKIILSFHDYKKTPENLQEIYSKINKLNPDYVKIVTKANNLGDNLKIFNLLNNNNNLIAHCLGILGQMSRILNLAHNSHLTYGCFQKDKLNLGQISCNLLKRVYRADKLNTQTKIFGLVGSPLSESISYLIHNLAFKEENFNAVYINFDLKDLKDFKSIMPLLNGFSITMPFKKEAINLVQDLKNKQINSINTAIKKDNSWAGYNTDYTAAKIILKNFKNTSALILGAGGAAIAIAHALKDFNCNITISNRTEKKGKNLAKKLGATYKNISEVDFSKIDLLINTTPVGMYPKIKDSPIARKFLQNLTVFDLVYNPAITKLISDAQRNGCTTISGLDFFCQQALEQFKLFTNLNPNKEEFEMILLENRLR